MAYDREQLKEQALKAAESEEVFFISDVVAMLPCSESTFYNYDLQELEFLKKKLQQNRIKAKQKLRAKWLESNNATLQLALYKLLGTNTERRKLSMQEIEIKADKEIPPMPEYLMPKNGN